MAKADGKDVLDREHVEKMLYSGRGLPGGGQLEIRIEISADHPDSDICGVARRVKFFNLESWHSEWIQVAEKNVELAADFEREERKVTAHEFYLRAADFYRRALVYLPETDPRMLPTYKKLENNFDKAWSLVSPPFERVQIPYEGHRLDALFLSGTRQIGKPSSRYLQLRRSRWDLAAGGRRRSRPIRAPRHVFYRCGRTGTRRDPQREKVVCPAGFGAAGQGRDRLFGHASGCRSDPDWPSRLQYGRLLRAALRDRGKPDQGSGSLERRLQSGQ
jgi:hypothetical protein